MWFLRHTVFSPDCSKKWCILFCRYLDENIRRNIRNPQPNLKADDSFIESNKMHGEIKTQRKLETHPIPQNLDVTEGKKLNDTRMDLRVIYYASLNKSE